MRWLLEMSTLVHVLGKKTCKKFLIKFHTVDGHSLDDACIDVVVSNDFEIVGHGFASKSNIFKASAQMPTNGLESHAHTAAVSLPYPMLMKMQSLSSCW